MGIYEKWKKEMEEKFSKEKIPAVIKRCPKCNNLSLEYDPKTGRIFCNKCGFEEYIKTIR